MAADAGDGPTEGSPAISRGQDFQTKQDQEQVIQTSLEEAKSKRKRKRTSGITGEKPFPSFCMRRQTRTTLAQKKYSRNPTTLLVEQYSTGRKQHGC